MTIAARINERSADALKWARIRSEAIARNNPDEVTLAEEAIARIADVVIGEQSMVTFRSFQATRKLVADVSTIDNAERDVVTQGYVYMGDAIIEIVDGVPLLTLFRNQYSGNDYSLEQLEAMLYAWCLSECGDDMGCTGDTWCFVSELISQMDWPEFAAALLANAADPDGVVCHMHDYCDPNQIALDATRTDDIDDAFAIYANARPFIRGE